LNFRRNIFLLLAIFLITENSPGQASRGNSENPVDLVFDNLQIAGIKTDQTLRYSYFFESKSLKTLQKFLNSYSLNTYSLVSSKKVSDSTYTLHIQRMEKHTRESLSKREAKLSSLAEKYKDVTYKGFDIGITEVTLPPLTHERFARPILTQSGSDLFRLGFLYYKLELLKDAIKTLETCVNLNIYPDTSHLISPTQGKPLRLTLAMPMPISIWD